MNWNVETLKEYFDKLLWDRDQAVALAVKELERRLDNLNHLHSQAVDDRRNFYSRDQHDTYAEEVQRQIEKIGDIQKNVLSTMVTREQHESYLAGIRREIEEIKSSIIEMQRPHWQLWIGAMGVVFSLAYGAYMVVLGPLQKELADLHQQLTTHEITSESMNMELQRWRNDHPDSHSPPAPPKH